jgi:hypothetical protein
MRSARRVQSRRIREFRLDFTLPDGPTPTATGRILADEYFALYVNGVLADSCTGFDFSSSSRAWVGRCTVAAAWLDDRLVGQTRQQVCRFS